MNLKELRTTTNRDFVKVTGRALREHVDAVTASGVSTDAIIEQAFRELYDQVQRERIAMGGAINGQVREIITREPRGDFLVEGPKTAKDKILELMESQPDQSFTIEDLIPKLKLTYNGVYKNLSDLQKAEQITSSQTRPKRYWLTKMGDPDFRAMLPPKGTRVEVLG